METPSRYQPRLHQAGDGERVVHGRRSHGREIGPIPLGRDTGAHQHRSARLGVGPGVEARGRRDVADGIDAGKRDDLPQQRRQGLLNTHAGVILPQVANGFGIFLLRQHLRVFPQALLDAARIDGASNLTALFRVVLPIVRPVVAALSVLFFINSWNQYVWPTIVLSNPEAMTLPIWLRQFMGAEAGASWGLLMAAAAMGVLPALLLSFAAQRLVLGSLAGAALKG